MSLIARIAVCQNPAGDGQYVPAEDTGDERCFVPGCGCTPVIYAREDHQRGAVERIEIMGEAIDAALEHLDPASDDRGKTRRLREYLLAVRGQ